MPSASSSGSGPLESTLCQRLAFGELHDDAADAVGFGDPEHVRDVGVIERRQHFCLALETREPIGVGRDIGGQDLDGDVPLQLRVAGAIDLAHSTHAELGDDFIRGEASAGGERQQRDYRLVPPPTAREGQGIVVADVVRLATESHDVQQRP